jgi:hypothetical protein
LKQSVSEEQTHTLPLSELNAGTCSGVSDVEGCDTKTLDSDVTTASSGEVLSPCPLVSLSDTGDINAGRDFSKDKV